MLGEPTGQEVKTTAGRYQILTDREKEPEMSVKIYSGRLYCDWNGPRDMSSFISDDDDDDRHCLEELQKTTKNIGQDSRLSEFETQPCCDLCR
jgi:hypothetical protein